MDHSRALSDLNQNPILTLGVRMVDQPVRLDNPTVEVAEMILTASRILVMAAVFYLGSRTC